MKLYTAPGACSLACDIALEESGLAFDRVLMSFEKGDLNTPEFLKINPMGAVPALEVSPGACLTEGPAILQYIADQNPSAGLMPSHGFDRYRALEWLNFITSELHKNTYGNLFATERLITDQDSQTEFRKNVAHGLNDRLDWVNARLEGKAFCLGDSFTVCDAYLFTVLSWSKHLGIDLSPWRNITSYQARVFERPGVQRAMKAEGLI